MNDKQNQISFHVYKILEHLGQNLEDENLVGTPDRVAKYLTEFLNFDPGNTDTVFESVIVDQMVILKNIPFWSLCSHHLLSFRGEITIGYITGSKVLGLSKLARVAQKHAHKLQLQERLAHDIANEIQSLLEDAGGVAVIVKANHSCMTMRGIKSEGEMVTSVLKGDFMEDEKVRVEFFSLLQI